LKTENRLKTKWWSYS